MPNYLIAAKLQTYLQISKGYFKNFCRFSEVIIDVDADFRRLFLCRMQIFGGFVK